jgi:MFS family permease
LNSPPADSPLAPFRWPDFRHLFIANVTATLASRTLAMVLVYEVYRLTGNPLAIGGLGLIEAIPALSLMLYGGHVADRHDRRKILLTTLGASVLCAVALAGLETTNLGRAHVFVLYAVVFIAGIARGFQEPTLLALEAQTVPRELLVSSSTLMGTCWLTSSVVGPLTAGLLYSTVHPSWLYAGVAALYAVSCISIAGVSPKPVPPPNEEETIWQSVATGVRFVMKNQVLLGSMALDLFAVLFGGAMALLPVFADEILKVDAVERGMLNAALPAGALLTMLLANRFPPVDHAGRNLFLAVAGFGVAMIVFALSRSTALSVAALLIAGACDGVSVVIRRAILRLMSPDHLRGRIAAVSMIFIGSSNELGAFESGVAASLLGTVRSVWVGATVTLFIVALVAALAPKLRRLSLEPSAIPVGSDAETRGQGDAETNADGARG